MSKSKTKTKKPVGRQPVIFTNEDKEKIEELAGLGLTNEQIAKYYKVCLNTLLKNCSIELELGKAKGLSIVTGELMKAIKNGNVTAMIFYLKTQARWKEADTHLEKKPEDNKLPVPNLIDITEGKK